MDILKNRIGVFSLFLMLLTLYTVSAWADTAPPPLSQVTFALTADKWLTSETANVTVAVHAQLTQEQLNAALPDILQSLQKISAAGKWYIMQMQRSQSQADLEQLEVMAQARLPSNVLSDLRHKAKAVSKQGMSFEITNIDYSPTDSELADAQASLRQQIYQLARAELQTLNQLYPEQHYALFAVNFNSPVTPQPIMPMYQKVTTANIVNQEVSAGTVQSVAGAVSQHLEQSAQVTLSAKAFVSEKTLH